jgi:hypothetical protein
MDTQAQWADAMRDAEKEKNRLREAASAARRDQKLSNDYNNDARRTMLAAYKYNDVTIITVPPVLVLS